MTAQDEKVGCVVQGAAAVMGGFMAPMVSSTLFRDVDYAPLGLQSDRPYR